MPANTLTDTRRAMLVSLVCVPLSLLRSAALITAVVLGLWAGTASGDVGSDVAAAGHAAIAVWLASFGVHIHALGGTWSLMPLTLTALTVWSCHRAGRRGLRELGTLPRAAALAFFAVFFAGHVLMVTLLAWWASAQGLVTSMLEAVAAVAMLVGIVCIWCAAHDPRAHLLNLTMPPMLMGAVTVARRTLLSLVGVCALALCISVVIHWSEAAALVQTYGTSAVVAVGLWTVSACIAPNIAIWGAGFLVGAPISVHATQTVSVFAGVATKLPPLPLLVVFPQRPASWAPAILLIAVVLACGFAVGATPSTIRGAGSLIGFAILTALCTGAFAAAGSYLASGAVGYAGWPRLGTDWHAAAMAAALAGGGAGLGAWWASRQRTSTRT